ncbi:MAG: protein kinase [Planctomycetaceae bacterium]
MTPDPTLNDGLVNVDSCVEAYESACAANGTANPDEFLPDRTHPDFRTIAIELLRVDLEYNWNDGRQDRLDQHFDNYPDVLNDTEAISQLAFEDYRLRLQAGLSVSPKCYATRYGADVTDWPDSSPDSAPHSFAAPNSADRDGNSPLITDRSTPSQPEAHRDTATKFQTAASPGELVDVAVGRPFLSFEILAELGAGIGGRVFLARQPALAERNVVLKVTRHKTIEAQRLASLQHSNIVPVYSVHDGEKLSAICMPYLGSTMLSHWVQHLRRQPLPSTASEFLNTLARARSESEVSAQESGDSAARLPSGREHVIRESDAIAFPLLQQAQKTADNYCRLVISMAKQLADGLCHAHRCGILHRDLKPANILLTNAGQPMLLDFHLSLQMNEHATGHESAGGTLPYMSPEQLRCLSDDAPVSVDQRADIYSLGVILFELLTGQLPFATSVGRLVEVTARAIEVRSAVPSLQTINSQVSAATEAIVQKCLHPDPLHRYQNAQQLADDLQRQLEHRPLLTAGNPSLTERVQKWFRRHPGATSTTTVSVICGLLLLFGFAAWNVREHRLATLQAFQTFTEVQQRLPEAMAALSVPSSDPDERAIAMASAKELISAYQLNSDAQWTDRPEFRLLQTHQQTQLKNRLGELLFLMASAERTLSSDRNTIKQSTGTEVRSLADEFDDADALRYNRLAVNCYAETAVPCALFDQQRVLYEHYGLDLQTLPARSADEGDSVADRVSEGTYLLMQNRVHSALKILEELGRQLPDDFQVWFRLGMCRYRVAHFAGARECFTTCLAISPNSHQALYWRGMTELRNDQFPIARQDFQRLLDEKPDDARALVCRGLAWMGEQQWKQAADDFSSAIDLGFPQTRIYFLRSQCHQKLGKEAAAKADRDLGLQMTPTDPISWVSRGIARLSANINGMPDAEGAIDDFRAAIRINSLEHEAYRNIAHVLAEKLNRTEEAVAVLNETLTDTNENALCWMGRAVLHARLNHTEAAHADMATAMKFSQAPLVLYQAACVHALAPLDDTSVAKALRLMGQAFEKDSSLIELALSDADLKRLHSNDRFRKLIAAARIMQLMNADETSNADVKK